MYPRHVDPILNVKPLEMYHLALAYQIILELLQIVDPNVSLMKNAQAIKPVSKKNVEIHVRAHVDLTQSAVFGIMFQSVYVLSAT